MIISGNNNINNARKVYGVDSLRTSKGATETGKSSSGSGVDAVELSNEGQGLQQVFAAIKAMPDVREDKVRELTPLVDSGQYKVEASKIAEQMLGRLMADKLK